MFEWLRKRVRRTYLHELTQSIDSPPEHIAVIQDGNRRYARERGMDNSSGHVHGADTTEDLLHWCNELSIREVTLYTLSTENFSRPDEEITALFDLVTEKLYQFADADLIHENEVRIRGLGDIHQLPQRVVDAVHYAEAQTDQYSHLQLNIALAYGGRNELLRTAQQVAQEVADGELTPADVSPAEIEDRLYREPIRNVDLIIRTGGDERTSNFLPWHANGNEAAVYFCTPYWPEFNKVEFFRAIRTYESREASWQHNRTHRAIALARSLAETEYHNRPRVIRRLRKRLTGKEAAEFDEAISAETEITQSDVDMPAED